MIIPFGHNCNTARSLREAGLREIAYPFDWSIMAFKPMLNLLTTAIASTDDQLDALMEEMFEIEEGATRSKYMIENELAFPHDDLETIKEKYTRRFRRLRDDYARSESVTLVVADLYNNRRDDVATLERSTENKVTILVIDSFGDVSGGDRVKKIFIPVPEHTRAAQLAGDHRFDLGEARQLLAGAVEEYFRKT